MKKPIRVVFAAALLASVTILGAQAEFLGKLQAVEPTSKLGQQAVAVALPELEARGLDKEQYAAEIYTRNSAVIVIFERRDLLDDEDDSVPALTLEVVLSDDARRVVDAYFAK